MEQERETRPDELEGKPPKPPLRQHSCVIAFEIITIIIVLAGTMGFLRYCLPRRSAPEAQVKSNLHAIQLAVERYAKDHEGEYPAFLIGGTAQYADLRRDWRRREFPSAPQDCSDLSQIIDPLVREGYMTRYPTNPFARTVNIHSWQVKYGDPLRNGTEEGKLRGTRFGPDCQLMGNVMADIRYTIFTLPGATEAIRTYADVEYPCADFWEPGARKPKPFLPGGFFYRSAGVIERVPDNYDGEVLLPDRITHYVLGGYGATETKGYDTLGPPKPVTLHKEDGTPVSVVIDPNPTSPLWFNHRTKEPQNGLPDSVIIVLISDNARMLEQETLWYQHQESESSSAPRK